MSRLRMGVLGAGGIAGHFASSSSKFASVELLAIGSRGFEKAQAFAAKHGIAKTYGSYQSVVDDPEIDAVYNALPNGLHKEWTIKCLRAGKHVLCEKPMALTRDDAQEMFEEADKNGALLIEGFIFRFQPQTLEVLRRVRSGELGEIITVTGCFGFRMRNSNNVRLDPTQGAGAMWDVGVYPLNLVRAVMREMPKFVRASSRCNSDGVDLTTTAILEYADGRQCSIWSSFESATFKRANIVGTEGAIDYVHTNHSSTPEEASFLVQSADGKEETIVTQPADGFVLEADAFASLVSGNKGQFVGTTRTETLENIATCEAIHASAKAGKRVAV